MANAQIPAYSEWLNSTLASDGTSGRGVMPAWIRPLKSDCLVTGPAHVVLAGQDDNQAIRQVVANPPAPGAVLVVAGHSNSRTATIGGLMALELQKLGFLAVITDGLVRDSREIRGLDIPVWCRGTTPIASAKDNPGVIGSPIRIGEATIREGDLVIADDDGIVIWPKEQTDQLAEKAWQKLEADNARLERLNAAK